MLQPNGSRAPEAGGDDISVLGLVNAILRQRWSIVGVMALCAIGAVVWVLLTPRSYTATSALMPQGRQAEPAAAGLAAQLGIGLQLRDETASPDFYASLLQSRSLLTSAIERPYRLDGRSVRLADALDVAAATPALRLDRTISALRSRLATRIDRKTGIVQLDVTLRDPRLAAAVNQRLVDLLGVFNVERRQSQASAERRFTQTRLEEAKRELRQAENELQSFLQRNRSYTGSPQLVFEHDRLTREIERRQSLYATLSQSFEQARIEEVRNTPVVTVLDPPDIPVRPDSRGGAKILALALLAGAVIGILLALWRDAVAGPGTLSPEHEEFRRLRQQLAAEMRHPVRALRRRMGGRVTAG